MKRPGKRKPFLILASIFIAAVWLAQSPSENATPSKTPAIIYQTPKSTIRPATPIPTAKPTETVRVTPRATNAPTVSPAPTIDTSAYTALSIGDYGDEVLSIKNQLAALGYFGSSTSFSKTYTENTADGIRRFQIDHGLPVTGIADPLTQYHLYGGAEETPRQLFSSKAAGTPRPTATVRITARPTATPYTSTQSYIGNRNTFKFHYPYCSSVDQMKESNKVHLTSREQAINRGYVPCKRCNP